MLIILSRVIYVFIKGNSIGKCTKINFKNIILFIIPVILILNSSLHLRFGVKLIGENEHNVREEIGIVEKLETKFFAPLYKNENGNSKLSIITISGNKYYIMSSFGVEVNDIVEIKYLEKSKFILEINVS